jgi:hypothetical protein
MHSRDAAREIRGFARWRVESFSNGRCSGNECVCLTTWVSLKRRGGWNCWNVGARCNNLLDKVGDREVSCDLS